MFHSVQALRALAALFVLAFHAHQNAGWASYQMLVKGESYVFHLGALGVHIFFVISGFVMVSSVSQVRGYRRSEFLIKRFFRIFPTYWLCVIFALIVYKAIGQKIDDMPLLGWVGVLSLWPGYSSAVIAPAWTLSYEIYFYMWFGLVVIWGIGPALSILTIAFLAAIGLRGVLHSEEGITDLVTNPLLLEFVAGTGIGWLMLKGRLPHTEGKRLVIVAVALYIAGLLAGYDRVPSVISWGVPSVLLVCGVVSWEVKTGASPLVQRLGAYGDGSYILYLTHKTLIFAMVAALQAVAPRQEINAMAFTAVATILCLMFGELAHTYIERPMLRLFKSLQLNSAQAISSGSQTSP